MAPTRGGTPQLSFRVGPLGPALDERSGSTPDANSRAQVAQRDLGRYYALLEIGLHEVVQLGLAESELSAICDALNGCPQLQLGGYAWPDPAPTSLYPAVVAELADSDRLSGLGAKWGVDVLRLIVRLRNLSALGIYALVEAVERWWRHPQLQALDAADLHRAVGLLPAREPAL